ncbi:MAG: hypothetical protein SNJ64_07055, partial [Endomicrobiia bacterium]
EFIVDEDERMVYTYDFISESSFIIELLEIKKKNPKTKYPVCTEANGEAPIAANTSSGKKAKKTEKKTTSKKKITSVTDLAKKTTAAAIAETGLKKSKKSISDEDEDIDEEEEEDEIDDIKDDYYQNDEDDINFDDLGDLEDFETFNKKIASKKFPALDDFDTTFVDDFDDPFIDDPLFDNIDDFNDRL